MRRFLAIDYGEARHGVAACAEPLFFPSPVETVAAQPPPAALERLVAIIVSRQATDIVVGLPIRQDGTEGTAAEKVRIFAKRLQSRLSKETSLPEPTWHFQDEYGSTNEAKARLWEAGRKEKKHRSVVDQAAAVVILGDFLRAAGLTEF